MTYQSMLVQYGTKVAKIILSPTLILFVMVLSLSNLLMLRELDVAVICNTDSSSLGTMIHCWNR